ncbi:helix-turn-helix domain-containing protein [Nocardiopsis suaedae]|uniref:Helix-turn-helix transcriptional regulator n=1 Tax=Nocardiopsis suaedae TaxID=3018444 RepID=A0ABT4TNJ3_9ACTN|nr:helix-turn-helix transcriptional regulator [Nocardiopsis suaedae]MDA2806260.1 helix-turn-helix transcriptional regulator [Nocardiopsis suaedae]
MGVPDGANGGPAVVVHLDELLERRGMTLAELARRVDVTVVNLSVLKNGRARAIRFSTLLRICEALGCQPGDLLSYRPGDGPPDSAAGPAEPPAGS